MSLNNLNSIILPCIPIGHRDSGMISFKDIHKEYDVITEEKVRKIKDFNFALLFSAIQNKFNNDVDDDVFDFNKEYRVCIRLTEMISGKSRDLDAFLTKEKFDKAKTESDYLNVLRFTHICFFDEVDLPEKTGEEQYAVKVLVKHITGDEAIDNETDWTIQSMYLISLKEE